MSTSLNATKIAVTKVSHLGVVGPELLFCIYKYCFFAQSSSAKWLRAEQPLAQHGSVNDPEGSEVAPPSVFHGHNFIG